MNNCSMPLKKEEKEKKKRKKRNKTPKIILQVQKFLCDQQRLTIQAVLKSGLEKHRFKVLKVLKSNSVEPVKSPALETCQNRD